MKNENTVKYFTVKNCHKANLVPTNDYPVNARNGRKCFVYKDCLFVTQRYSRYFGTDLCVAGKDHFLFRSPIDIICSNSAEGKEFNRIFTDVKEIDISLLQEKLDAIIKRVEMVKAGILPEDESAEFVNRLRKEIENRKAVLQNIPIPSDWDNKHYLGDLVILVDHIRDIRQDIEKLEKALLNYTESNDIKRKMCISGSFEWPSDYCIRAIKDMIKRDFQ